MSEKSTQENNIRQLVLNFSGHPVLSKQQQDIRILMGWISVVVIDVTLGNVPEDNNFIGSIVGAIDDICLSPDEWQSIPMVVIPSGYSPIWSIVLAELHGRLGYFPDVVRFRASIQPSSERFEVAEIMNLREVRHQSRRKRS